MKNQLIHLFDKPDQTAAIARAALILCCFLEDDPFCSLGCIALLRGEKKRPRFLAARGCYVKTLG